MRRAGALALLFGGLLSVAACGSNTKSHANDPQRSICFSSMECASYMRCVKGPNAINGYCRSAHEAERLAAPTRPADAGAPPADAGASALDGSPDAASPGPATADSGLF